MGHRDRCTLLINSTGIKGEGEGEWKARKHGDPKYRILREVHLGIDDQTLDIQAVDFTNRIIGGCDPRKPSLIAVPRLSGTISDRWRSGPTA